MTTQPSDSAMNPWPFACEHDDMRAPCVDAAQFTVSVEESGAPIDSRQSCAQHVVASLEWALAYPTPYEGEAADAYLTDLERRITVSAFGP